MKKTPGQFFRTNRLSNIFLCFIIVLSLMMTVSGPARAQSPFDDALAQMQAVRQQLAELLAMYQSSDAEVRAATDAAMASAIQQALQQTYYSMSSSDRAALDAEARRMSGYSFTQLMQSASTIPGLVRMVDILISGLENLAGVKSTPIPTPQPTPKPQPTPTPKTPVKTPSPTPKNPTPDGAIDIGSGQLKLGWVLYGRTDLSEQAAQAIYDGRVKERKAALDKSIAAETERLNKDKLKLAMFEKSLKDKNAQGITSALNSDLADATKERTQAATDLGTFFLKEFTSKASTTFEKAFALNDVATGAYDMQSLTMKTERTQSDWEKAGKGLAGILTAVAGEAGYKVVGPVASSAELLADCIYLHLADARVRGLENSIVQTNTTLQNNTDRLQQQIRMDNERIAALQQERTALIDTSYLDLR